MLDAGTPVQIASEPTCNRSAVVKNAGQTGEVTIMVAPPQGNVPVQVDDPKTEAGVILVPRGDIKRTDG